MANGVVYCPVCRWPVVTLTGREWKFACRGCDIYFTVNSTGRAERAVAARDAAEAAAQSSDRSG